MVSLSYRSLECGRVSVEAKRLGSDVHGAPAFPYVAHLRFMGEVGLAYLEGHALRRFLPMVLRRQRPAPVSETRALARAACAESERTSVL